jgi:hypothetical protein
MFAHESKFVNMFSIVFNMMFKMVFLMYVVGELGRVGVVEGEAATT